MFIKTVKDNHVDVFFGKGWEQWVRLQRVPAKDGTIIKRVAGNFKPDSKLMEVLKNKIKWNK